MKSLSSLEILKIVIKICDRSPKVVRLEYSTHFYLSLKTLAKRNVLGQLNEMQQHGISIRDKLIHLMKLFQPADDTKDEVWKDSIPVLVDITCGYKNFFKEGILKDLMVQHPEKFTKTDVEKLIESYKKYEPLKIGDLIILFYDTHAQVLCDYQQKLLECENIECALRYFVQLSRKDGSASVSLLPEIVKKGLTEKPEKTFVLRVCLITMLFTEVVFKSPLAVLQFLERLHRAFKLCNLRMHNLSKDLTHHLIYLYGILGRALESDKHASEILGYLLELEKRIDRDTIKNLLKAINNIVEGRPQLMTEQIQTTLKPYCNHLDPDIRVLSNQILNGAKSDDSKRISEMELSMQVINNFPIYDLFLNRVL